MFRTFLIFLGFFCVFKFPILKQNFLRKYKRFQAEIFRKCSWLLKLVCKAKNCIYWSGRRWIVFSKFQMKQKFFYCIKISAIMEIIEGLKFSCFTDKFTIYTWSVFGSFWCFHKGSSYKNLVQCYILCWFLLTQQYFCWFKYFL